MAANDMIYQRLTDFGKVKIRGPLYNPEFSIADDINDFDFVDVEVNDANVEVEDDELDVGDDCFDKDERVPGLEGGYDFDLLESNSGSKRSASEISAVDDDNPDRKYSRQRNLHPYEIIVILDDYHSMFAQTQIGKKKFYEWAAKNHGRSKLQPKSLRDWLNDEDNIRALAILDHSDRRSMSVPRQQYGHCY